MDLDPMALPCRILDASDGVLRLRYPRFELSFRFWPQPFIEIRMDNEADREDPFDLGAKLLLRATKQALKPKIPQQMFFVFDLFTEDRDRRWSFERILDLFTSRIPDRVRQCIQQFRERQWELLLWAAHSSEVMDLMESNPMLLALWLEKYGDRSEELDERVFQHMRLPQHRQMEILELPSQPKWAKLLRKIPLKEIRHLHWMTFRVLSHFEGSKHFDCLQHSLKISAYEIYLVQVAQLIGRRPEWFSAHTLTGMMGLILNTIERTHKPEGLRLPRALEQVERRLERPVDWEWPPLEYCEWKSELPFPCPDGWEHLDILEKVAAEGRSQKNCLGRSGDYMEDGVYLFKIVRPARATACVKKNAMGRFALCECLGPCNSDLSLQHLLEIRRSLNNALATQVRELADSN